MFRLIFKSFFKKATNYKILFSSFISIFVLLLNFFVIYNIRTIKENMMSKSLSTNSLASIVDETITYDFSEFDFISDSKKFVFGPHSNYGDIWKINDVENNAFLSYRIIGVDYNRDSFFSKNELIEYQQKTDEPILKYGRYPKANDEILIIEDMFNQASQTLDENHVEQLLNKSFSSKVGFAASNTVGKPIIENVKIVGILNKKIRDLDFYAQFQTNYIFCSNQYVFDDIFQNSYVIAAYMNDYKDIDKRLALLNEKFGDNQFAFSDSLKQEFLGSIEKYGELVFAMILIVSILLIIGLFIYSILTLYFDLQKNGIRYDIYYACGFTKKKNFITLVTNLAFVFLIASVFSGTIFGVLFISLTGITELMSYMTLPFTIYLYSYIASTIILFLSSAVIHFLFFNKRTS